MSVPASLGAHRLPAWPRQLHADAPAAADRCDLAYLAPFTD